MDPRKRLQVLQANNPSLRVATQPKPQLQVSRPAPVATTNEEAPAQTLSINTGQRTVQVAPGGTVAGAKPKPVVHKSLADTLVPGYKAPAEAIARILPGGMNDVKAEQERGAQALRDTIFIRDQIKKGKITPEAGQNIINSNAQTAADAARNVTNTVNAMPTKTQVAAGFGNIASDIVTAGIGAELAPTLSLKNAAVTALKGSVSALPQGVLEPVAEKKNVTAKDIITSTLANVATGAALPFAFKGIGEAAGAAKNALGLGKTSKALTNLGIDKSTIKFLQAEKDPEVIKTILEDKLGSTNGLEGLIQNIANTEDAKFIRKALADLPIESGAATTLAGAASEAAARAKYGVDPITGEKVPLPKTTPEATPTPSEGGIQMGQPNELDLQSAKLPADDLAAIEQAGGEVPKALPANTKSFNDLPKTAGDGFVMSDAAAPKIKQITKELNQINRSLADIRDGKVPATRESIASLQLRHDQLVEEAQKPFDFNAVDGTAPEPKTQPEAPKTGEAPTEEQVAAATAKTQSGVADSAPSEPAAQTETPAPDQKVTEDINTNADNAAKNIDGKTIRYTDAETGKTKIATVQELRDDIKAFKEKYGTEDLTPKQQRKLAELERNYNIATFDAEKHMVGATPEEKGAVQKIIDGLSENLKNYDTAKKLRSKERAIRFAKGTGANESAGGGMDGYRAKLGSMKGKMAMPKFNSVSLDPEARDSVLNLIETNGKARGWQDGKRLNTQTAILKVMGEVDGAPTPSDIRNIREFFGDEVADTVQEAVEKHPNDWNSVVTGIAGLPKSLMSTFDFSAPRQAGQLAAAHPIQFVKSYAKSIKAAFNEDYFNKSYVEKWRNDPEFDMITEDMGVDIPGVSTVAEERYANANIAEKIPLYGKSVIKGSERAYNYLLGDLRGNVAKNVIKKAGGPEGFKSAMSSNYGDKSKEATRIWGETINTLSGRGGAKGGVLEKHMSTASATLFSPRLWASKVQQLNPVWYGKLAKNNPAAAKEALKAQAAFYAMVGTTLYLASRNPNVEVGTDMRSADFGKIKVGNTRFDIMGGQQQNMVQLWRQVSGEKVNSETGEVKKLGEGYGSTTRFDLFVDMLISKSNPLINTAVQISKSTDNPDSKNPLDRMNQYGDKTNLGGDIASLAVPLNVQGVVDTTKDTGSIAKGVAYNAPGVVGVGVNTYGTTATKDQGKKQPDGTVEFKGKVTNDMVLDPNGKPILDKKGIPVKVKIPEGATKAEVRALKDQKRESAMKDAYKRSLPEEDQALLGRSDSELKKYVKDGVINQAKYDKLKGYRAKMDNMGKIDDYNPSNIPDGIDAKSTTGKFFAKYNSLDKEAKKEFISKNNTTAESKALVDELNNNPENPKSVPKLSKGNNQLALLYANYQADLKKPGVTDIDKQNKAKAFWNAALNTQYDSVSQDLVKEGSSADFKALYADGKISREQLAQAIQLDNALYQTGWNKLKFSKKWREDNGIAVPTKTTDGKELGTGSGDGSGGGKSKATPNAYLSNLLPSSSGGSGSAKLPQFSEKRRQIKFAPSVNVGKSSNSAKKVSINL